MSVTKLFQLLMFFFFTTFLNVPVMFRNWVDMSRKIRLNNNLFIFLFLLTCF